MMDIERIRQSKRRDFFILRAPREAFSAVIGAGNNIRAVILDLQRWDDCVGAARVDGVPVRVIPFPQAHRTLAQILIAPQPEARPETLEVMLPRWTFDHLADRQGAARMERLDLEAGLAVDDSVLRHLAESLEHALSTAEPASTSVVDRVTEAMNVHLAQRWGGLRLGRSPQRGGLAPWQLRKAWDFFDRHLDGTAQLDRLASECGLSVSHFSRAFRRSTGVAPHRWLLQRRVEVAKDMMLAESTPLAQVAVACGFADQSHFTRTFASLIGLTPARWRTIQMQGFGLVPDRQRALG